MASNVRIIVNDELERVAKETVVAFYGTILAFA
jgi:hypothetical protein